MKRIIAFGVLCYALCGTSFGVIFFFVEAPQDTREARAWAAQQPELKPSQDEYFNTIEARLWPLKFSEMEPIFGPKLDTATNWWASGGAEDSSGSGPQLRHHPANLVLPLFASRGGTNCGGMLTMMVSGLHSLELTQNKSHTDLYAVGNFGYVELYSQLDGERVQAAVIYFRADDRFVPLRATNDFTARLAWDMAKFNAIKKWFDSHLVQAGDAQKH